MPRRKRATARRISWKPPSGQGSTSASKCPPCALGSTQGTRTDTGPALDILGETAGNFQLAISDAARATNMQASAIRQQGKMGIWEAKQVKKAATMQAIGTGIQGVTQAVAAYGHNRFTGAIK